MLMDDKSYPFIKVTVEEPFPRIMLARKMVKDHARYFGPYTSAGAVKDTIELIRKLYHIRSCSRNLPRDKGKERPCLNYHIHQCNAPCQGYISQEEYRKAITVSCFPVSARFHRSRKLQILPGKIGIFWLLPRKRRTRWCRCSLSVGEG